MEAEFDFERKCAVLWAKGAKVESTDLAPSTPRFGGQSPVAATFKLGDGSVTVRVKTIWWKLIQELNAEQPLK
eukprot:9914393-Alexandrium_andersonii.AAC.1